MCASPTPPGTCRRPAATPKAEYRSAAYSRRGVLRHRRSVGRDEPPAPHAGAGAEIRQPHAQLGLGDGNLIVVYDGAGIYSAPRAWWMLRAMGHEDVVVLDGGLPKWRREGRPLDDLAPVPAPPPFHAAARTTRCCATSRRCCDNLRSRRRTGAGCAQRRRASPARSQSRAPACAAAISPAASMFRTRS